MTVKQWKGIHARLARIHEAIDPIEGVKVRGLISLAMQKVDERIAEIEKGRER